MESEKEKLLETLNPDERAILPHLAEKTLSAISKKSELDKIKVSRALQFLENKGIVELRKTEKKIIDLDDNGIIYLRSELPERRLLHLFEKNKTIDLEEARKNAKLSENELEAAIGVLKKKDMIELQKGRIIFTGNLGEIAKKSLEEQFIETLPLEQEKLKPEQKLAFEKLKNRKNIVKIITEKQVLVNLTELGKQITKEDLTKLKNLIEELTPEIIKTDSWKGRKFRRYDITSPVPEISGGKKHFVNQAIEHARKIWTELGFKEMSGNSTQIGFWNFDALFTPQDHPVREMQDTFYIKNIKGKLPDKKIVKAVKQSHESGVNKSKGWQYQWKEDEARKVILRTHTTCLSSKTLSLLGRLKTEERKGKFFAIGKCFRNETIDASHLFEFNQTEGIVVNRDANFIHLLGYLKAFLNKMGFVKIRFRPHFFPYTEPSVEADVYDEKSKKWIEILGAGIFRPEVVVPLLGEYIPVLAWGMGFDRLVMENYNIKDIRELYGNDITKLREIKFW